MTTNLEYFEFEVTIEMESGLHARPAGILVKVASQYKSKVEIEKSGNRKNAKSIMSLMSLGAVRGDSVKFIIQGEDASTVGEKIQNLFLNRFQLDV